MNRDILQFLQDLKLNNNREWFQMNKDRYRKAKQGFEIFIDKLIPEIRKFDSSIDLITASDCLFRIYRDVRFSGDKSPYKTNMGAYIARGGKNSQFAGYYVHVEHGGSMLAGGVYMPQPEILKRFREEIYYNITEFRQILHHKSFLKYFDKLIDEGKLVNPPKDFPKDFSDIDLLKHKNYTVVHVVEDDLLVSSGFLAYAVEVFSYLYPLNQFLNRAIS